MSETETERPVRVIGDLITTDLHALGTDPISQVARLWESYPGVDGMAVLDGSRPRYLSRSRFFVQLGKRFGYSLFENRPVSMLAEEGSTVEADMDPIEVISIATQREAERIYDDIVVLENRQFRGLVSMRSLLVHHKALLANGIAERSQLEERNRRLEDLNRLQGDFIGSLTRELRSPSGTVLAIARSVLADQGLGHGHRRSLTALVQCAQDALGTVNDLQDLLRVETGTLVPEIEPVALGTFVRELVAQTRAFVADRGIEVTARVPEGSLPASTDPVLVRRVLSSLLRASLDRAAEGGVTVEASIEGGHLVCSIRGCGVSLSDEEWRQLGSSAPVAWGWRAGRDGLRLAAAKEILRVLQATVEPWPAEGDSGLVVRIPSG